MPLNKKRQISHFEEFYCDMCDQKIQEKYLFYCTKKSNKHKQGYDLCVECSLKKTTQKYI